MFGLWVYWSTSYSSITICCISGQYSRDRAEVVPIRSSNLTISSSPMYEGAHLAVNGSLMDSERISGSEFLAPPLPHPPPPTFFLGYSLPPGHPCNSFTLPPPPADRKRTGPRREYTPQSIFRPFFLLKYYTCWKMPQPVQWPQHENWLNTWAGSFER